MKSTNLALRIASFAVITAGLASAARAPLPDNSAYVGLPNPKTVSFSGRVGSAAGGGGGAFAGTVTPNPANVLGNLETTFWCVDSQLFFNTNEQNLKANITRLDQVAGAAANTVRYQEISALAPTAPGWTNDVNGAAAGLVSATERFRMAAYLVSQYDGFSSNPVAMTGTAKNDALQKAIWAIMHNNVSPAGGTSTFDLVTGADNTLALQQAKSDYWRQQAVANYATVDMTRWAVVSWIADGGILETNPDSADKQTFLVQVVPEPGFYGALALGLSGLVVAVRRRNTKA
ncbi:MAG: PEP-CTERM sorting domain-containing protein [Acidobacteria bacterium]|nr:PEP-CTERM sorting domain-containing protein [Acidobacteriota bacterium]